MQWTTCDAGTKALVKVCESLLKVNLKPDKDIENSIYPYSANSPCAHGICAVPSGCLQLPEPPLYRAQLNRLLSR